MAHNFNPKEFLNAQLLPVQDLKQPSFCSSSKAVKIQAWADNLRATKISHTSVLLYQSIAELNRVKSDYENRFKFMEAIRPIVQNCIEGIKGEYLQRPLALNEDQQKFAIIAQALQKYMVDGYMLCAREIANLPRFKANTLELMSTVLQRAMAGVGLFFFRSHQLYASAPKGMWQTLHGLYQVAEYYELLDKTVSDPLEHNASAFSVQAAWVRVLMLSTAKANQLSNNDIAKAYTAFASWATLVKIHEGVSSDKDNFYLVNISQDEAPSYKSRFEGKETDRVIELDFKTLLGRLSKQGGNKEDTEIDGHRPTVPKDFPDTLLDHLLGAWGNLSQRKLGRRDVNITADIAIGFIDCHYFLAGKKKFDEFVSGNSDYEQAGTSFTPQAFGKDFDNSESDRPTWNVQVQNVSTGGYCLLWKGEKPIRLESGELICLKEKNRYSWNLGVIRWIKQLKSGTQMGVQLLSSQAQACGAAQIFDMGGQSDFMRALLIPKNSSLNPADSIVTPKAPFTESQKVKIMSGERIVSIRLNKCLFSTGSLKQFAYAELAGTEEEVKTRHASNYSGSAGGFDSSWDDI